jgi:ABC-type xylose transport system permease subunit
VAEVVESGAGETDIVADAAEREGRVTGPPWCCAGGVARAAIDNGMGLQGYSAAAKNVVTAVVLLVAVIIDSVARRNAAR